MSQVSFAKKVLVLLHIPFIPLLLVGQFGIGLNSHYQDCLYMLENGFYARPTINFILIGIIYILLNLLYLFVLWTHHHRLPNLLLSQSKRVYATSFGIHIAIYLLGLLSFFYLDCTNMWGLWWRRWLWQREFYYFYILSLSLYHWYCNYPSKGYLAQYYGCFSWMW